MADKDNQLIIEQVNHFQKSGGAARISWILHEAFLERSLDSYLAVGVKESDDGSVYQIPNEQHRSYLGEFLYSLYNRLNENGNPVEQGFLKKNLNRILNFKNVTSDYFGVQQSHFPGTKQLLNLPPKKPNILHLHNLHQNYFDFTRIPLLSKKIPVVCTLHDEWLMTGHCAYSLACQRWKNGCGNCPDLKRYPGMRKDATHFNWKRKQKLFSESYLYLAAPSKYVADYAEESILAPAIQKIRVIHNGVNLNIFKPVNKKAIREKLGIPQDAYVLLYIVAGSMDYHPYKDFMTVDKALKIIESKIENKKVVFIGLGGSELKEITGEISYRFVPYQNKLEDVAAYYQAADIYLHAAKAETFSNVVLEARACGTPVVATGIGGILDQIRHEDNGLLVAPGDYQAMADETLRLMNDHELWTNICKNGIEDARENFSEEKMVESYLTFYEEAFEDWKTRFG